MIKEGPFTWHNGQVPEGLRIQQVYGILFDKFGRILLRTDGLDDYTKFTFAGGKTEDFDKDMVDTLTREVKEEVNTTIKNPIIIGYQEVDEGNGTPIYAQVRMVAMIDNIGPAQPDPDNGRTYRRLLTAPQKAKALIDWGKIGDEVIDQAVKLAGEHYGITTHLTQDEYV